MVHEAVSREHLEHMRQLDQNLTDGACFGHVLRRNLASVVGAVFGEDAVDLRILDGAEHKGLPIVPDPVVEVPHSHPGEVHPMGVKWLQVHVLHHMLEDKMSINCNLCLQMKTSIWSSKPVYLS